MYLKESYQLFIVKGNGNKACDETQEAYVSPRKFTYVKLVVHAVRYRSKTPSSYKDLSDQAKGLYFPGTATG
jgi:hypothetical protein